MAMNEANFASVSGSYAAAGGQDAQSIATKMMGGAVLGRSVEASRAVNGGERPTLHHAIQAANEAAKRLDMHRDSMIGLAETAEAIAHRLHGPFPSDAGGGARGESPDREPISSAEAVFRAVSDLHPRISNLDSPAQRIARALDAISRAIG